MGWWCVAMAWSIGWCLWVVPMGLCTEMSDRNEWSIIAFPFSLLLRGRRLGRTLHSLEGYWSRELLPRWFSTAIKCYWSVSILVSSDSSISKLRNGWLLFLLLGFRCIPYLGFLMLGCCISDDIIPILSDLRVYLSWWRGDSVSLTFPSLTGWNFNVWTGVLTLFVILPIVCISLLVWSY